eukprot:2845757-Alexandrium_andersonii.AAC.1
MDQTMGAVLRLAGNAATGIGGHRTVLGCNPCRGPMCAPTRVVRAPVFLPVGLLFAPGQVQAPTGQSQGVWGPALLPVHPPARSAGFGHQAYAH